jgi:hypothetical protein
LGTKQQQLLARNKTVLLNVSHKSIDMTMVLLKIDTKESIISKLVEIIVGIIVLCYHDVGIISHHIVWTS